MSKYKIGVYQICKNEQGFVMRWYNSIKDEQDGIFVTDTGSTDGTLELLKTLPGVMVFEQAVSPWRFDLQRNMSLMNVPQDYDILLQLDLDEVMEQGWRNEIEKNWNSNLNQMLYQYIYSWQDEQQTIPRVSMYNFKIHRRHDCFWQYPVHEVVEYNDRGVKPEDTFKHVDTIKCYHHPNLVKSRPYFDLLKLCIQEFPNDTRHYYLLQREYLIFSQFEECIKASLEYLKISYRPVIDTTENQVRQIVMRYIQQSIIQINEKKGVQDMGEQIQWMLKQLGEDPYSRESWGWAQKQWGSVGNYPLTYQCQDMQLSITNKKLSMESEELYWGDYPQKMYNYQWKQVEILNSKKSNIKKE